MTPPLHVNGRFLIQPISGVQRYARELLTALDARLGADPALAARIGPVSVWYPAGADLIDPPDWSVLKIRPLAGLRGHAWEQITLGRRAREGILLSLCGAGPLICANQLLVIHDANIWAFPEAFPRNYRLFHKVMRPLLARRVAHLATVSQFSASELARCLHVSAERFTVIYNSAEHMLSASGDAETLDRHGLRAGEYFFAAGNQSPNKNIARLIDALGTISSDSLPLAVAGGFAPGLAQAEIAATDRIRLLGRVTDAEIKTLYANAAAFVWPSLYEGFGIPPLEAMSLGTPVLSSNTTAMPEVLGNTALFFDPTDTVAIAGSIQTFLAYTTEQRAALGVAGREQARRFSWSASADQVLNLLVPEPS
ncbi:glycosyltransferase family 4 protein [Puniceibacterium sediminis]|uniref:Glycosyltransferase involved in cell wall bisynthesis n=1 Tax=Puniceibacterium sediminis TaxID=1608407 RepID=A0A238ZR15_9RHOB|nr:glycosyltransferase family 1 protein [Puniceibacterium sediminis]SNR85388.1 Glycosyltransferase involved in cell wall bisynthesis [Puniceibacterium sediminis]